MNGSIYRHTYAEINLDAITHNLLFFQQKLENKAQIMAVIKANAYGHGAIPIAKHLESLGIAYLAVACVGEGIELRDGGVTSPILVLGYTPKEVIKAAFKYDLTVTAFSKETLEEINQYGSIFQQKLNVHIKIDTGMARIGLAPEEVGRFIEDTKQLPWVNIEGIYTHFAKADEKDKAFTWQQQQRFANAISKIDSGFLIPFIHLSNSAAMIDMPEIPQNMARLGISLYGLLPSEEVNMSSQILQPALTLKTKVSHIKKLEVGQTVSYGGTFTTERETWVATLPIGYADGLSRSLSNKGTVLINGKKAPIIGRVCMDQTMIDVTGIESVEVGTEVVIIGKQGNQEIRVDDIALLVETINYELVTLIGRRIPRVYIKNGEVVAIKNSLIKGE